jgi:type I restriction enzyme S subunit
MKEGWSNCKIGDICSITDFVSNGSFASLKENVKYYNSPNYAVLVRLADASNGFDRSKFVYTDEHGYDFSKKSHLHGGELIMSNVGSVGSMFICPVMKQPMTLAPNTISITSQNNRFLYYYFLSDGFKAKLKGITSSTTLKKFNKTNFKLLEICIPSLSEQQSIVDYLDSAFAKIDAMKANAEKALNEAQALFHASLKEMLEPKDGWVTSTLKDECFKITDGTHQTPKYYPSGYIFLSSKNVTSRKIDWEDVKFIDESQHQLMYKRVAPQVGDILLAKNGTTGVAAMVDRDVVFDIYVSLALLRSRGNVTPEYLLAFVNSPIAKEQFDKRLIGMGVPNLHLGEINQVVITYPEDKVEQIKVTQRIEELDNFIIRLQANYDKISKECDALKQAILKQVFE